MAISITGNTLTFEELYRVALSGETASLAPEARARMQDSRAVVEQLLASGQTADGQRRRSRRRRPGQGRCRRLQDRDQRLCRLRPRRSPLSRGPAIDDDGDPSDKEGVRFLSDARAAVASGRPPLRRPALQILRRERVDRTTR